MDNSRNKKKIYDSGQAIVIILLSLSVALTIVLFILSRSVTDITTSTEQADSVRAFSAAEAGVEKALITGTGEDYNFGDSSYSVTVSNTGPGSSYNYPIKLFSGDTATLWLTDHDINGNMTTPKYTGSYIDICWGANPIQGTVPAIEASLYYDGSSGSINFPNVKIFRVTADASDERINGFGASGGNCTINSVNYSYSIRITPVNAGPLFLKVRMLYNDTISNPIGFKGDADFSSQGVEVTSVGTSGIAGNESNRKIVVSRGWPEFPFSGSAIYYPYGGITK